MNEDDGITRTARAGGVIVEAIIADLDKLSAHELEREEAGSGKQGRNETIRF